MGNTYQMRPGKLSPNFPTVITITEQNGVYSIAERAGESIFPTIDYPTAEAAGARVLQLLGITEPVAPQNHPEAVEVTLSAGTERT